jgi:N,N'-diacetyllegionaminate synthase
MNNNTYIIAEIGINHEGSISNCKRMIEAAFNCGVDAVKLQTINADANYVKGTKSHNVFKNSELTQNETQEAFNLANEFGIDIFTTVGDLETMHWVDDLNPSHWKISSGLLTHIPFIGQLAMLKRPLLMSTGMADEIEIDLAMEEARLKGATDISLFQCTSIYPTPFEEVNLSTIGWMKEKYQCPIGFSDHSDGDDAVFLSIAAGATLIEKHFSLDNSKNGFDHRVSMDEHGLKRMVERVRLAEKIMGNEKKKISKAVEKTRDNSLRYIVATKPIAIGDRFSISNINIKRTLPGISGLEPKSYEDVIGQVSLSNIKIDQSIQSCDFQRI